MTLLIIFLEAGGTLLFCGYNKETIVNEAKIFIDYNLILNEI